MRAVIRAVLLDPEATAAADPASTFGKLREPVVRYASILRQLGATSADGYIFNTGYVLQELGKQHPMSAPSVFNFYLPAHSPAGEIANAGRVAPEFQITTSNSVIGMTNLIDFMLLGDYVTDAPPPFETVSLTYADFLPVANDVERLVDRMDIMFTAGTLDPATRAAIAGVLSDIDDTNFRTRIGLYLFLISPDYAARL